MSSIHGSGDQQWVQNNLPPEKKEKPTKLEDASARKLAKNILTGKMSTSGEVKSNLGVHGMKALSQQITQKKIDLMRKGTPGKITRTFQQVKNFLTAGGRAVTDLELLKMAQTDLETKFEKASKNAPQPRGYVFLARGNIAENQFPGKKTVVVNSANTKLEWGRGGTNRALSDVIPKKTWEKEYGRTSHLPFARNPDRIVVGEAVSGPEISKDFSMIQALGPRLNGKTTLEDLPKLQMQVFEAYNNALKMAKNQGAECVQVPQFCTGSFMRGASDEVKKAWPDMVNTAFLAAVQAQNPDRSMKVTMVIPEGVPEPDFATASQGVAALNERLTGMHSESIRIVKEIAANDGMVAFYKDGPTACFGNFCTVPGGFETGTPKLRFSNVEAALHHAKATHAIKIGGEKAKALAADPMYKELQLCKTGEEALRLGRALEKKYRTLYANSASEWHNGVKQAAVFQALQAKFALEPFRSLLEATGDTYLLEHKASPKAQDNYWSDGGDGRGVNALGIMLMAIRDGEEMPGLVINPNREDYVPDDEVMKHSSLAKEGLGYTIYGSGHSVGRPGGARERTENESVTSKKTVRWDPELGVPVDGGVGTIKGRSTREVRSATMPTRGDTVFLRLGKSYDESYTFTSSQRVKRKEAEAALKLKEIPVTFDRLTTQSILGAIERVGKATKNEGLSFDRMQRGFFEDCISQVVDAFIDSGEEMTPDKFKNELLKLIEERNTREEECVFEDWTSVLLHMREYSTPAEVNRLDDAYEDGSWKAGETQKMTWYVFPEYGEKGKVPFKHELTSAKAVINALCMDPIFISRVLSEIGQTNPVDIPVIHELLSNEELLKIVNTDPRAALELGKRYLETDPEIAEQYLEVASEDPSLNQEAAVLLRNLEYFQLMPNLEEVEAEIGQTNPVDVKVLSNEELLKLVNTDPRAALELGKRYLQTDPEIAEQYLEVASEDPSLNQEAAVLLRNLEYFQPMPNLEEVEADLSKELKNAPVSKETQMLLKRINIKLRNIIDPMPPITDIQKREKLLQLKNSSDFIRLLELEEAIDPEKRISKDVMAQIHILNEKLGL